jgi:hypothetical protein
MILYILFLYAKKELEVLKNGRKSEKRISEI